MVNSQDSGALTRASAFAERSHQDRVNAIQRTGSALASAPAQMMAAQRHQAQMQSASMESQLRLAGQRLRQQQLAQNTANYQAELQMRQMRAQTQRMEAETAQIRAQAAKEEASRGDQPKVRAFDPYRVFIHPEWNAPATIGFDSQGRPRPQRLSAEAAERWKSEQEREQDYKERSLRVRERAAESLDTYRQETLRVRSSEDIRQAARARMQADVQIIKTIGDALRDPITQDVVTEEERALYEAAMKRQSRRESAPEQTRSAPRRSISPVLDGLRDKIKNPETRAKLELLEQLMSRER